MRRRTPGVGSLATALLATGLLWLPAMVRAQLPDRIDPIEIGDDTARVRFSLIMQLQLVLRAEESGAVSREPRLRRVRPVVHATFFEGRLASRLHVEANPENPELIDAWVELTLHEAIRLRGGQLKIPFTDYWQRSLTEMAVDWPLTSRWFGGERQLGAMAHGHLPSGWRYAVSLFSGEGRRTAFARELGRLYGDPPPNPSSLTDPRAPGEVHAEFVGRVAHHAEGVEAGAAMDRSGSSELRHAAALSVAWDTAPVPGQDFALRLSPELLYRIAGLSVSLIGYVGFVETRNDAFALGAVGGLLEVGWRLHRHLELAVRYARVGLAEALRLDAGSTLTGQHEATLVVQAPIFGRSLILQADVAWLRAEKRDRASDDMRVRLQLQLVF